MKIDESIIGFLNKKKKCDDVILRLYANDANLSRFGLNRITQNMSKKIEQITVRAIKGRRSGAAVTTQRGKAALLATLRKAEHIASTMAEDPEFVQPLKPQECKRVEMEVKRTAHITPLEKAKKILKITEEAKKKNATLAGYFENGRSRFAVLNTRGFYCDQTLTRSTFSITAKINGASGFAEASHEDVDRVDVDRLFQRALQIAEMNREPVEIPPGEYPVILEPLAWGQLLFFLQYLMDRRSADEGWSYFSKKLGKRIAAPSITIFSDPSYQPCPSVPFDFQNEGIPLRKQVWIKDGILRKLWTTRYWAKKKGIKATGMPLNLIVKGGTASIDEMVRKAKHGLLITRLWYIRFVNRRELILTGMTRDGLFLVENGKISRAVKNMRFNDSPFTILKHAKILGECARVEGRFYVPAIYASKFNFASVTKF
jgi:predicted Zn-dependent protease